MIIQLAKNTAVNTDYVIGVSRCADDKTEVWLSYRDSSYPTPGSYDKKVIIYKSFDDIVKLLKGGK